MDESTASTYPGDCDLNLPLWELSLQSSEALDAYRDPSRSSSALPGVWTLVVDTSLQIEDRWSSRMLSGLGESVAPLAKSSGAPHRPDPDRNPPARPLVAIVGVELALVSHTPAPGHSHWHPDHRSAADYQSCSPAGSTCFVHSMAASFPHNCRADSPRLC